MTVTPTAEQVRAVVLAHQYTYRDEDELQAAVAGVLTTAGMPVTREVPLTGRDRIDLLVGTVGVEVKIHGGWADLTRQCQRYAASDRVTEILAVTTRSSHIFGLPPTIGGKPLLSALVGAWL